MIDQARDVMAQCKQAFHVTWKPPCTCLTHPTTAAPVPEQQEDPVMESGTPFGPQEPAQ